MKGKPFDHYLQEALRELDKPCEEFDEQKCQRLLERYCSALVSSQNPRENRKKAAEAVIRNTPNLTSGV